MIAIVFYTFAGEQAELPIQGMRLLGGTSVGVEISVNNVWAQICTDLWNLNDA